jgi:tRNA G26 N,N-dimethylase Trm1
MTTERAIEDCGPPAIENDPVGWTERDFDLERRRVARSVRNISEEAEVIDAHHHIVVDDLAAWLGVGAPPSPRRMVEALQKSGHRAGLTHYGRPSFRTDSPWEDVAGAARSLQPPM